MKTRCRQNETPRHDKVTDKTFGNNAILMDGLDNIHMAQNMNLLDAKMECNNSIPFAVGSATHKSAASGLKTAVGLRPDAPPAPSGVNLPALWERMRDSYSWEKVAVDSSKVGNTAPAQSQPAPWTEPSDSSRASTVLPSQAVMRTRTCILCMPCHERISTGPSYDRKPCAFM